MIEHIDTIVIAAIFLALHVALIVYIILNMYNRRKGERELYADIHRQNTNIEDIKATIVTLQTQLQYYQNDQRALWKKIEDHDRQLRVIDSELTRIDLYSVTKRWRDNK